MTKTNLDEGSAYLSIFAREREPLHRLFEGRTLFLSPRDVNFPNSPALGAKTVASLEALQQPGETGDVETAFSYGGKQLELTVHKNIDPAKAQLSFICKDLSDMSEYTKSIDTPLYRMLKNHLPGPYTFILPASKQVPKILQSKKSTVGLRVPDNTICQYILTELGNPILSSSLPGEMVEEYTDPEIIFEKFEHLVDIVIDGGMGGMIPSTIIDCTSSEWVVIRDGLGVWE